MVVWDEIGLCRKTIFQATKNRFFAHAWTAANPRRIDVDRRPGTLFSLTTWRKLKLCRKSIFQAPKNVFFARAWTASNRTWNIVYPKTWRKEPRPESSLRPLRLSPPRCWLSYAVSGCFSNFKAIKTKLAGTAKKLSWSRALQKNIFSSSDWFSRIFGLLPIQKKWLCG